MSTTTPTPGPAAFLDGEALTTLDLARRFKRSPQTIRAFVKHEGLPVHRIRGRMYFLPDEVERWVQSRTAAATDPPTDLREHRDHIKKLVDEAPPLTAEQVAVIRRVLTGGAA